MPLELIVSQDDAAIQQHKEDMRPSRHRCPVCGLKKMMTIIEMQEHNDECLGHHKRR